MRSIIILAILFCATISVISLVNVSATSTKIQIMQSNFTSNFTRSLDVVDCNDRTDCDGNGRCSMDGTTSVCICDSSYATDKGSGPLPEKQCTYKRKKQLVALLLHIFLGEFGVGEFYIGNIGWGVGQLILGGGLGIAAIALLFIIGPGVVCVLCLGPLAFLGWWIADIVFFARNDKVDGNGYGLAPI